jgi:REP element-mobilizing transposase RayT
MGYHLTPRGWHCRGYLPHFDGGEIAQAVTFRLADSDSLPVRLLKRWAEELAHLEAKQFDAERRRRIENYLDIGSGVAWMKHSGIATIVENALLHFDGVRYKLPAWVVMPNHVHALLVPKAGFLLEDIVHSRKSFTSNKANKALHRTGHFWQPDYYDRFIRNAEHYLDAIDYIENNPVKAGLCDSPEDWPFSSARFRAQLAHTDAGRMPAVPE